MDRADLLAFGAQPLDRLFDRAFALVSAVATSLGESAGGILLNIGAFGSSEDDADLEGSDDEPVYGVPGVTGTVANTSHVVLTSTKPGDTAITVVPAIGDALALLAARPGCLRGRGCGAGLTGRQGGNSGGRCLGGDGGHRDALLGGRLRFILVQPHSARKAGTETAGPLRAAGRDVDSGPRSLGGFMRFRGILNRPG